MLVKDALHELIALSLQYQGTATETILSPVSGYTQNESWLFIDDHTLMDRS